MLLEYIPINTDNAKSSISRKRQEYFDTCLIYNSLLENPNNNMTESELKMYKQILVDVPRTMTEYKLFTYERIRKMILRLLYVWSKRHPASGYVQGFNDLLTPFVAVFITDYVKIDMNDLDISEEIINSLPDSDMLELEADSYWCFKKMMDKIQTNYINGQPGLQYMLEKIEEIIKLVDSALLDKIFKFDLKFIEFGFRWINCYLMREFSLKLIIRLWDSYFSLEDSFNTFHLFVCACLLLNFSDHIKKMSDYQEVIMFLQNMPLAKWSLDDIEILLAKSYQIYSLYGYVISGTKSNTSSVNGSNNSKK
jgi:TBC1 domain family member 2